MNLSVTTSCSPKKVKLEALKQIVAAVKSERRRLCQLKPKPSVLCMKSSDELKAVTLELKQRAPSCSRVISIKGTPSNVGQTEKEGMKTHADGMPGAVLPKERNQNMCKPQTIISTLLYAGHASKKVIYTFC